MTTHLDIEKERLEFEDWAREADLKTRRADESRNGTYHGEYYDDETCAAWMGYLAARRASLQADEGKDAELIPCAYRIGPIALGAVKIEEVGQIEGPSLWAVRQNGNCLNKQGEWEWEPMPSGRDDEFLARCRFASASEARAAITAKEGK